MALIGSMAASNCMYAEHLPACLAAGGGLAFALALVKIPPIIPTFKVGILAGQVTIPTY
jgi:hypothetical protein